MKININLIIDIYKKAAIIIAILSFVSFIAISFFSNFHNGFSFFIGSFLISLNVLGITLIGKFSNMGEKIDHEKIGIAIALFVGKLVLLLIILFFLIYFKLVNEKLLIAGLSLGFIIFFIANIVFIPLKVYKIENIKE